MKEPIELVLKYKRILGSVLQTSFHHPTEGGLLMGWGIWKVGEGESPALWAQLVLLLLHLHPPSSHMQEKGTVTHVDPVGMSKCGCLQRAVTFSSLQKGHLVKSWWYMRARLCLCCSGRLPSYLLNSTSAKVLKARVCAVLMLQQSSWALHLTGDWLNVFQHIKELTTRTGVAPKPLQLTVLFQDSYN